MAIEIRPVTSLRDLKLFIRFPFTLYRGNPYWVPPLISDELNTLRSDGNPAFDHCTARYWLAYDGHDIVGRIAGIINRKFIETWKQRYARFAWVDFVDSPEVAGALYGAVEGWARSEGMTAVHGPLGFTDMDREGMLVEGFQELATIATNFNFPYYPRYTEQQGYRKEADWLEFEIKVPAVIPEKALRIAELTLQRRKLHILQARRARDLLPYARGIFDVINKTYGDLLGFVPLTEKQIDLYVKQYIPNVVPDYVKVILDERNAVAGFVIAIPSLSRALQKARGRLLPFGFLYLLSALRRPKYLDLLLGAIRPDLQGKGADALLITELARSCIANGIVSAESNLELESNVLVQAHWRYFERRQHKRRRCYIKELKS